MTPVNLKPPIPKKVEKKQEDQSFSTLFRDLRSPSGLSIPSESKLKSNSVTVKKESMIENAPSVQVSKKGSMMDESPSYLKSQSKL